MNNCSCCGKPTKSYTVDISQLCMKVPETMPICSSCIDTYLIDNELDSIIERSEFVNKKGEVINYFVKAIIVSKPLYADLQRYSYHIRRSWRPLLYTTRIWYNTSMKEAVENVVYSCFTIEDDMITTKQLAALHAMLNLERDFYTHSSLCKHLGIDSLKELTKEEASVQINNMRRRLEIDND